MKFNFKSKKVEIVYSVQRLTSLRADSAKRYLKFKRISELRGKRGQCY